jgi:hypothetical protein
MIRLLFSSALRSIALRWVLALLLLVAQQGALTHALGHAAGHAHESVATLHDHEHHIAAQADDPCHQPKVQRVSEQCAFDLVYSQVLGALHAGHSLQFDATDPLVHAVFALRTRSAPAGVPYDSRGPPIFS